MYIRTVNCCYTINIHTICSSVCIYTTLIYVEGCFSFMETADYFVHDFGFLKRNTLYIFTPCDSPLNYDQFDSQQHISIVFRF